MQNEIILKPVAFVKTKRNQPIDDNWAEFTSEIVLAEDIPSEALLNVEAFSHLDIIYYFDKAQKTDMVYAGHPRGNKDWTYSGIFAQRKKDRPNAIGLCTVQLIEKKERSIVVKYLDAIDGTPVLDIKPVVKQFEPKGEIKQPAWVDELMQNYW